MKNSLPCPASCPWTWARTLGGKFPKFDCKSCKTRLAGARPDAVGVVVGKTDGVAAVKGVVVGFGFCCWILFED